MERVRWVFQVLWAPRQTMAKVADRPAVLIPLIPVTLFAAVEAAVLFFRFDPTALQLANRIGSVFLPILLVGFVSVFLVVGFGSTARQVGFGKLSSVVAFASAPFMVRSIVNIAAALALPVSMLSLDRIRGLSPLLFLDPASLSPFALAGASMVDLTLVWILALLAMGCRAVLPSEVGTARRAAVIGAPWLALAAFRLGITVLVNGFTTVTIN